jgi:uncharacterized iron-regulated membrane protein
MLRRFFVWLHRWTGLFMAGFLIIEGLTGSLIAFNTDLTRLFDPQLFVTPEPDMRPLDLATLAERAETLVPHAGVGYFAKVRDDQVILRCHGRTDQGTGKPYDIGFKYLVLDPYTGKELGRLGNNFYTRGFFPNIMPFVYDLHVSLALGQAGEWILATMAVLWTIDCFTGFYLTLPVAIANFFRRWKTAWLIKRRAGFFRLNFDLHRASGLWLWPMLFVFAWSSVNLLDRMGVYNWITQTLCDYQTPMDEILSWPRHPVDEPPKLDWRAAQDDGELLLEKQASKEGFKIVKPDGFTYFSSNGLYNYSVQTDRMFPSDKRASVIFNADTGVFYKTMGTGADHTGNTVTNWLRALHTISDPVDYLPYRIFVCIGGLVLTTLSITGVYIWWKKRQARRFSASHRIGLGDRTHVDMAAP